MKHFIIWENKTVRNIITIVFWLTAWQAVSFCLPTVLFASPAQTVQALVRIAVEAEFWVSILHTLSLTALGFLFAFICGNILAVLCHRMPFLSVLLGPAIQVMKSVPITCFIVVALIWISSNYISVLVSFFVVFPVTFVSLENGLNLLNRQLNEMAQVFRIPIKKRVRQIYLPQLLPDILAGCRMSVGMCWKASVAGEIIGLPMHSIGEKLYLAKLYLATDELFAWTIVIILISLFFEKIMIFLLSVFQKKLEASNAYPI